MVGDSSESLAASTLPATNLLSIVIPTLNCGNLLSEALASVIEQDVDGIELVVVDGGSLDDTKSVLTRFESSSLIRWISEPDDGLYDALNKGIDLAKGDWIGWLNCDDIYPRNALRRVKDAMFETEADIICGDAELFRTVNEGEQVILKRFRHYRGDRFDDSHDNLRVAHLNACFFRRTLLSKVGGFKKIYKIVADRDYLLRLMRVAPMSIHIGEVTYRYRTHSGSLTMAGYDSVRNRTISSVPIQVQSEFISVCQEHLKRSDTTENVRKWCLHTLIGSVTSQAVVALRMREFRRFLSVARIGFAHAPVRCLCSFVRKMFSESRSGKLKEAERNSTN